MRSATDSATAGLELRSKSVLLIDENPHTRNFLVEICRTLHVRVELAMPAAQALGVLEAGRFDFVICSWTQGPLDTLGFLRRVRASENESVRKVPIIVTKANATVAEVTAARDAGMTEFLSPPISIEGLLAKFRAILLKPRAFVDADRYHGPDRRRRTPAPDDAHHRRSSDPHADGDAPEAAPDKDAAPTEQDENTVLI